MLGASGGGQDLALGMGLRGDAEGLEILVFGAPTSARIRATTWTGSATGGLTSARWDGVRGSEPTCRITSLVPLGRRRLADLAWRRARLGTAHAVLVSERNNRDWWRGRRDSFPTDWAP